jgi:hypothetical protein
VILSVVALLLQNPAATPPRAVHVWLGSPSPLVRGAPVRVYVEAGQDGNLVVLHRRTDGRIEVLFPKNPNTDPFVRGGGTYEIRDPDERAAWVVAEPDGNGMVLAALSTDPLRFDEFVRAAAWDSAALVPAWSDADAAGSMSDIVQRMLGDGYFNYDVVSYSVAPPVYAQQDVTPQETSPAYDAYPTCLDCTFIGEQLIIYEPVFVGHRFHRERANSGASPRGQPHPTPAMALALGPQSGSTVAPPSVARGSRFAPPRHTPGPAPIEPRARQRPAPAIASAQTTGPRTHVRYTRFSAPAPEHSAVAIARLPAPGVAPAPLGRAGLAIARADVSGRAGLRSDFTVPGRERDMPASQAPVRSRSAAVARVAEGASQSASRGVAIPREAWSGAHSRAGIARGGVGVRQR